MKATALIIPIVALLAACGEESYYESPRTTAAYYETQDMGPGVDIQMYPRTWYDGAWVYNVNGRYYFRHGHHWYVYQTLPPGLVFETYPHQREYEYRQHYDKHHEREQREERIDE